MVVSSSIHDINDSRVKEIIVVNYCRDLNSLIKKRKKMEVICVAAVCDLLLVAPCPPEKMIYMDYYNHMQEQNMSAIEIGFISNKCKMASYNKTDSCGDSVACSTDEIACYCTDFRKYKLDYDTLPNIQCNRTDAGTSSSPSNDGTPMNSIIDQDDLLIVPYLAEVRTHSSAYTHRGHYHFCIFIVLINVIFFFIKKCDKHPSSK